MQQIRGSAEIQEGQFLPGPALHQLGRVGGEEAPGLGPAPAAAQEPGRPGRAAEWGLCEASLLWPPRPPPGGAVRLGHRARTPRPLRRGPGPGGRGRSGARPRRRRGASWPGGCGAAS